MVLAPRTLALAAGSVLMLAAMSAAASAATTHTLRLTATRMASHASGAAVVTRTSRDDYRITITASGLPVPSTLPTRVKRHVYIAWALGSGSTRSHLVTQGDVLLHASHAGSYTGRGVIMTAHLGRILVTAEASATVRRPALPPEGVLISGM